VSGLIALRCDDDGSIADVQLRTMVRNQDSESESKRFAQPLHRRTNVSVRKFRSHWARRARPVREHGRFNHRPWRESESCRRTVRFSAAGVGSRSTPLCDIEGSVHWLRLKQQAARFPDLSFESVFSIRIVRVPAFLVDPIQRIQSQRATGVMSVQTLRASGSDASALRKSAGILGSGHSAIGSIAMDTRSPTAALAALRIVALTLNQ
jgi:hypothetical protein